MCDLTYEKLKILLDLEEVEVDYLFGILTSVAEAEYGWTLAEKKAAEAIVRKLKAPA